MADLNQFVSGIGSWLAKKKPMNQSVASGVNEGQALPNLDVKKIPFLGGILGASAGPGQPSVGQFISGTAKAGAAGQPAAPLASTTTGTPVSASGGLAGQAAADPAVRAMQDQVMQALSERMQGKLGQGTLDTINKQAQSQRTAANMRQSASGAQGGGLQLAYENEIDRAVAGEIAKQAAQQQEQAINQLMQYQSLTQQAGFKQQELQQAQQKIANEIWELNEKAKLGRLTLEETQRWHSLQAQSTSLRDQLAQEEQTRKDEAGKWAFWKDLAGIALPAVGSTVGPAGTAVGSWLGSKVKGWLS